MCYWKQWRWTRTTIRHLLDLGVSLESGIKHGGSSKGWWHMAHRGAATGCCPTPSPDTNSPGDCLCPAGGSVGPLARRGLQDWLKAQGLVSVMALWCKAQGYTT
jgi:RNA-directed DNA polymerase